jgi:undecaprenyl-diphosphatase
LSVLQALVLGIVQGLAEFLPISSSGHLVIVPAVFGWDSHDIAFDVLLHAGTLVAVVLFFRRDLTHMAVAAFSRDAARASDRRLAWLVVAGTVPTVAIALAFGGFFEDLFGQVAWVGAFLGVTSATLALSETFGRRHLATEDRLKWWHAGLIGVAQGAAIAPGVSRSGATIAAGLGVGLDRKRSARFSFLLYVPIVFAATAKTFLDVAGGEASLPGLAPSVVGFLAAAVTGYLAIAGLLAYLEKRSLYAFALYTGVVGVAVLLWQYAV